MPTTPRQRWCAGSGRNALCDDDAHPDFDGYAYPHFGAQALSQRRDEQDQYRDQGDDQAKEDKAPLVAPYFRYGQMNRC